MQTRCPRCEAWTSLPSHYAAARPPHVRCDACAGDLPASSYRDRYDLCRVCAHRYLTEYGRCPVCPAADDIVVALSWQRACLDTAAAPLVAPLSNRYCAALWQSYQQDQTGKGERAPARPAAAARNGANGHNGATHAPAPAHAAVAAPPSPSVSALLPVGPAVLFELPEVVPLAAAGAQTDSPAPVLRADEGLSGVEYELIQDPARLVEVADLLAAEPILGVDTETDGLDPYSVRLLLLQVATPHKAYIVDCQRVDPLPLKPDPGGRPRAQAAAERQIRLQDPQAHRGHRAGRLSSIRCSPSAC